MLVRTTQTAFVFAALTTAGTAAAACVAVDNLRVCGAWQNVSGGKTLSGAARIKRPNSSATRFTLADVDLFYGNGGISGQASFAMPSVSAFGSGAAGEVRGDVRIFTSAPNDQTVTVGDVDIAIEQGQSAVVIDYASGLEGNLGGVDFGAGEGGALVLVPDSKTFFISGDFAGIPTGPVDVGAIGVSLNGALTYHGTQEVTDGDDWFLPEVEAGHLYLEGTIPFGRYPIYIDGRVFFDLDADNDGTTAMQDGESDSDYIVAGEGVAYLGYTLGAFDLSIPVGEGAMVIEGGDDGALFAVGSTTNPQWFAGTPLAFLDGGEQREAWTYWNLEGGDVENFVIGYSQTNSSIAGFSLMGFEAELTEDSVHVRGTMPGNTFGDLTVEGDIEADGDFTLTGTGNVRVLGYQLANASVTVTPTGAFVAGNIRLPFGEMVVSGTIKADGTFNLTGHGDIGMGQLSLSDTDITITQNGVAIAGTVSVPGFSLGMSGTIEGGTVFMSARATKSLGGVSLGNALFTFNGREIEVSDTYRFAGQNFTLHGRIQDNGAVMVVGSVSVGGSWTFGGTGVSLSGSASVIVHGSTQGAQMTANASVRACGHYTVGKTCKSKSASISSDGKVRIKFPLVGNKTVDIL